MKPAFMLSLVLKATTLAQGQPLPDELHALLQQANAHFSLLKQQEIQYKSVNTQTNIVQAAIRPNVQLNGAYAYVLPVPGITLPIQGGETVIKFAPTQSENANLSASQTLYDFGRTRALIRLAADNAQILHRTYELTQQTLAYQVTTAYYSIGFLQQAIVIQDSVVKTATATVKVLATRLQNGDALQYDVFSQQVRVKTAINRKIELQNQFERQLATLTYLTGTTQPVTRGAFQNLLARIQAKSESALNVTGDLQTTLANSKDLLLAQDRLKASQADILVSQRAKGPTIAVSGSAGVKNGYPPAIERLQTNLVAGVTLQVPIYAGNRYTLQQQVAQFTRNASQYTVDEVEAKLRQRLTELQADSRSIQRQLINLDAQVLQAREALVIANARFTNGLITTAELQNAQTGVEEAELSRLAMQYQLLINQLEQKRLLGESLP